MTARAYDNGTLTWALTATDRILFGAFVAVAVAVNDNAHVCRGLAPEATS
jgi:hypothetical protein